MTAAQNNKADEWLTLASQSNISAHSQDYTDLMALMADEDQVVISAVSEAILTLVS